MTFPAESAGFHRLAPPLQRWLWEQGWSRLREAQAAALPLLLEGESDVVIAAATASGKTEAAFLPLLTRLWQGEGQGLVLYVAPMKALINDQFERLGLICERLDLPVTPWQWRCRRGAAQTLLCRPARGGADYPGIAGILAVSPGRGIGPPLHRPGSGGGG